jgi:hypothetical protein
MNANHDALQAVTGNMQGGGLWDVQLLCLFVCLTVVDEQGLMMPGRILAKFQQLNSVVQIK